MVKSVAKIFKGDGTLESPYLIETTEDMVKLADFIDLTSFDYSGFCFRLVNDLDFKGADWKIIVPNTTRFNASFDGNGKTISGYRFENLDNATGVGRFVGPSAWWDRAAPSATSPWPARSAPASMPAALPATSTV